MKTNPYLASFTMIAMIAFGALAEETTTTLPVTEPAPSKASGLPSSLEPQAATPELLQITGADPNFSLISPGFEGVRPNSQQPEPGRKPEFIAAPIPFYSPGLGAGLAVAAGYIFPANSKDLVSPPSLAGIGGFYSESESWAFGGGAKLNLDEDRYRIMMGGAHASINTSFYGIGNAAGQTGKSIDLNQEFTGGLVEVLRQTIPHLYVGGRYLGFNMNTSIRRNDESQFPIASAVERDAQLTIAAAGFRLLYDDTNSQFFPTTGWVVDLQANIFNEAVGSDRDFQVYSLAVEHYLSLGPSDVLALRGFGRYASESAPFWAMSSFGIHNDLRGYDAGRYRDQMMLATQVEWRHQFSSRWGAVLFTGVGEVAPDLQSLNLEDLLPSVGTGIRYVISKQNHVSFRFDVAVGRDDCAIYFGIGEAF